MRNIADNRFFHMILLFTIIGEFIVPWILERFYSEYNGKIMVMSVLGSPQSPVRLVYNIWLIWLGGFLAYTAGVYFLSLRARFPVLAVFMLLSIGIFAVGAGLISGFFMCEREQRHSYYSLKDTWDRCCNRVYGFTAFPVTKWNCSF